MTSLLEVEHLCVWLPIDGQQRPILTDVSLSLNAGEALGIVGESGSGKSMTARAIARLLPPGAEIAGSVTFDGADVLTRAAKALRQLRSDVAIIFQDPRAHINPLRRIGDFMTEAVLARGGFDKAGAWRRAGELLGDMGISDPGRRLHQYPHELSGGMLQRVMIASTLMTDPRLILADEPTTALDVTTQAEVVAILDELRRERGVALIFITHDLDLAAAICERTAVFYAGEIVDVQASATLHDDPLHPYMAGLAAARPDISSSAHRLQVIQGNPVSAYEAPAGCRFAPRCPHVEERCRSGPIALEPIASGLSRCVRAQELRGHAALGVGAADD
ncbi:MAG TPA: ABC transporter ATP-binding protein [Solirubrobacteraceae bacterium]|nr:ABC transporter ATP-binding protein [Solirubrobacteraceae bacterium]